MIRLVLDSTCDFSLEYASKHHIEIVPLSVTFGEKVYKENIDLTKEEFYKMMAASDDLPKTSQPSPQDFLNVFEQLTSEGHQIICLTVTSALSGTYQSAMLAKTICGSEDIEIIDTKNVAMGIQIQAMEILKMIEQGLSFETIVEKAKENVSKVRLMAAVDTLENLIKGGRLSKTEGLIGSLISIKPVIGFNEEGTIATLGKFRGMKKAISNMIEIARNDDVDGSKAMCVGYTANPENMNRMLEGMLDSRFHFEAQFAVGAVIGTHAGPNAAAIAYFVK